MRFAVRSCLAFLILIALSVESLGATRHHIPAGADEFGPNVPIVGSSLFDKIYSTTTNTGEAKYDVPFPLERLIDKVGKGRGEFAHTLFPFSRSLQRPQDLSYDPIANPRIVFGPTRDRESLTRGKLFFGYVKARDQIEVISYNDEAGRYEFQIITQYSQNPKVFYADRGKCLTCHQGQAGIFSPPGWNDSSQGVMGHLLVRKVGLTENTIPNRMIAVKQLIGPIASHDNVAMFDALVRESNQIALDERTWLYGCGTDTKCRFGLLLRTLSPNSRYTNDFFTHAHRVIAESSLKSQTHFHSFLTSTSFGTLKVIQKYGSVDEVVTNPQAWLEIIGQLYNLEPEDNPATPRPQSLDPKDLAVPLTGFLLSDLERLQKAVPDPNRVAEILIRKYEANDPLFAADSINKLEVMRALFDAVGSPEADQYSYWLTKSTPRKVLFEEPLPPVFKRTELNLFSRHCSKCHATDLKFPPQFLIGTEGEVVTHMTDLKSRLLFKLESGLMPPNPTDRDVMRASPDFDRMVEYVKGL